MLHWFGRIFLTQANHFLIAQNLLLNGNVQTSKLSQLVNITAVSNLTLTQVIVATTVLEVLPLVAAANSEVQQTLKDIVSQCK